VEVCPIMFNLGVRWKSVVNVTPQPLFAWERTLAGI